MEAEFDSQNITNLRQGSLHVQEAEDVVGIKSENSNQYTDNPDSNCEGTNPSDIKNESQNRDLGEVAGDVQCLSVKNEPGDSCETSQNNDQFLNKKGKNERMGISRKSNTHNSSDLYTEMGVDVASMVQNLLQSRQPGISPLQCSQCDLQCPSLSTLEFHTKLHVMERIVQSAYELPGIGLKRQNNQLNGAINDEIYRLMSNDENISCETSTQENISEDTNNSCIEVTPDIDIISEELDPQEQGSTQMLNHIISSDTEENPLVERESDNSPDIPISEVTDNEKLKNYEAQLNNLDQSSAGSKGFQCSECDYKCPSNSIMKLHMVKHSDARPFACSVCDSKFKAKNNLKEHMLTHSTSKGFSCTRCEYTCLRKAQLTRHMVRHTGEKRHSCPHCDYRCSERGNLAKHLLTHGDEKPFSCPVEDCDYKCKLKCNLKTHMLKHTGIKPYECHLCDYKSIAKGGLTAHMFKHTGEKPFLCSVCGNRYALKGDLNVHMRIHTDNKKFKCQQCDYRCFTQQRIDQHMLTHTGEKPYKCDECGFRFTSTSHLKRHKRTHTGDKPYACTECDYRCARNDKLKIHMQSHLTGQLKPGFQSAKISNSKQFKTTNKIINSTNEISDSMKKSNIISQNPNENTTYREAPSDDNPMSSHGIFGSLGIGSSQLPNDVTGHQPEASSNLNQNNSSQSHNSHPTFHQGITDSLNDHNDLGNNSIMDRNNPETPHSDPNYKMYSQNMEYYSLAKRYSHFPQSPKPLWPQSSSSLSNEGYSHQVLNDKLLNTGKVPTHASENLAHISQNYSHTPLTSYPRPMFVDSAELSHLNSKIPSTMPVPPNMTDVLRHASSKKY